MSVINSRGNRYKATTLFVNSCINRGGGDAFCEVDMTGKLDIIQLFSPPPEQRKARDETERDRETQRERRTERGKRMFSSVFYFYFVSFLFLFFLHPEQLKLRAPDFRLYFLSTNAGLVAGLCCLHQHTAGEVLACRFCGNEYARALASESGLSFLLALR